MCLFSIFEIIKLPINKVNLSTVFIKLIYLFLTDRRERTNMFENRDASVLLIYLTFRTDVRKFITVMFKKERRSTYLGSGREIEREFRF